MEEHKSTGGVIGIIVVIIVIIVGGIFFWGSRISPNNEGTNVNVETTDDADDIINDVDSLDLEASTELPDLSN